MDLFVYEQKQTVGCWREKREGWSDVGGNDRGRGGDGGGDEREKSRVLKRKNGRRWSEMVWSEMMTENNNKRLKIIFIIFIYLKLYLGFKPFKTLTSSVKTGQLQ